jgi:hypothetical protein
MIINLLENEQFSRKDVAAHSQLPYKTVCDIYRKYCKSGKRNLAKRGGYKKKS